MLPVQRRTKTLESTSQRRRPRNPLPHRGLTCGESSFSWRQLWSQGGWVTGNGARTPSAHAHPKQNARHTPSRTREDAHISQPHVASSRWVERPVVRMPACQRLSRPAESDTEHAGLCGRPRRLMQPHASGTHHCSQPSHAYHPPRAQRHPPPPPDCTNRQSPPPDHTTRDPPPDYYCRTGHSWWLNAALAASMLISPVTALPTEEDTDHVINVSLVIVLLILIGVGLYFVRRIVQLRRLRASQHQYSTESEVEQDEDRDHMFLRTDEVERGKEVPAFGMGVTYEAVWRNLPVSYRVLELVPSREEVKRMNGEERKGNESHQLIHHETGTSSNATELSFEEATGPDAKSVFSDEKEVGGLMMYDVMQKRLESMMRLRHRSLLKLLGVCTEVPGRYGLVYEHVPEGFLQPVLLDGSVSLSWEQRLTMASDIAQGLQYLHARDPPVVQGRLSSLEVFCDEHKRCRLMVNNLDQLTDGRHFLNPNDRDVGASPLPYWTAPEVLEGRAPTQKSDVYSFGVVLWEIMFRKKPFVDRIKELQLSTNVAIIQEMSKGLRPGFTAACETRTRQLIESCWARHPSERPSFEKVVVELDELFRLEVDVSCFADRESGDEQNGGTQNGRGAGCSIRYEGDRMPWMYRLDEVQMVKKLGEGSFGEVWEAEFRGRRVACKKLTNGISPKVLNAFVAELNVLQQLSHPNIVMFMGAVLEEKESFIMIEYCEKGSLYDVLRDTSTHLDYNRIIDIADSMATALQFLHESTNKGGKPLVHRDFRSPNILLTADGVVKVADFGLSDYMDADSAGALSTRWAAPEVLTNAGSYSTASDVYSFGIVLWELLSKKLPFADLDVHQAALAVLGEDKRPTIPGYVPRRFKTLIKACWTRESQNRPTLKHVRQMLKLLKSEGIPRVELSLDNCELWRKKILVFAFPCRDRCIVYKSWGTGKSQPGDFFIVGDNDDVYSCDRQIFLSTYAPLPAPPPNQFRKVGVIFGLEMKDDYMVETMEGMEHGVGGSFLAQNPVDGEQWPIARKTFLKIYEPVPEQIAPQRKHSKHLAANCINGPNYTPPGNDVFARYEKLLAGEVVMDESESEEDEVGALDEKTSDLIAQAMKGINSKMDAALHEMEDETADDGNGDELPPMTEPASATAAVDGDKMAMDLKGDVLDEELEHKSEEPSRADARSSPVEAQNDRPAEHDVSPEAEVDAEEPLVVPELESKVQDNVEERDSPMRGALSPPESALPTFPHNTTVLHAAPSGLLSPYSDEPSKVESMSQSPGVPSFDLAAAMAAEQPPGPQNVQVVTVLSSVEKQPSSPALVAPLFQPPAQSDAQSGGGAPSTPTVPAVVTDPDQHPFAPETAE